jgi:hypothetical protein
MNAAEERSPEIGEAVDDKAAMTYDPARDRELERDPQGRLILRQLASSPGPFEESDLLAVAEVFETLESDPDAVLRRRAQSWPHCCFCGKRLTDPDSLGRGYGPECASQFRLAHAGAQRQRTLLAGASGT